MISIQIEVFYRPRFANLLELERCVNVAVSIQLSALNFQFGKIELFEYVEQILDVTAILLGLRVIHYIRRAMELMEQYPRRRTPADRGHS